MELYLKSVFLVFLTIAFFIFVPQMVSAKSDTFAVLGIGLVALYLPIVYMLLRSIIPRVLKIFKEKS